MKNFQAGADPVAQSDMLNVLPKAFGWVKVGRIERQHEEVLPREADPGNKQPDLGAPVDGRAIPDNAQAIAGDLQQMDEEVDDVQAVHRLPAGSEFAPVAVGFRAMAQTIGQQSQLLQR